MNNYKQLVISAAAVWLLTGLLTESWAQRRPNTHFVPYSSVTFGGGTSTYFGDLAGYSHPFKSLFTLPRWNLGIGYTRQFTPNFAARATFTWARITGDDYTFGKSDPNKFAAQYARNLHFRNDLKEFAVTGIYNFIEDGRNSSVRAKFTPYVFGGLALVAHSPEARTPTASDTSNQYGARTWVKLQPLHTEGQGQPGYQKPYSLVTLAIPVGIGARYRLNENFNLGVEIGYRYTFTDYLDDVGGPYASPDALQGLAKTMSDRRLEPDASRVNVTRNPSVQDFRQTNPDQFTTTAMRGADGIFNDGYLLTTFSIQYIIPIKIKCPPTK
ncbi:outer membrane beta-barrel protein [Spirosoma sp. KCTC 42546]|uniref:DUF6089 family protein n=1 Tax=Spirosoma sp. KCTC 42546 TaxID=2520506 RepID=UPI001158044D|nr:DUF6089 family protein [Spirosoma sp. KCTC 42546]QDK78776.1 outer membrane beta-barrel protein [Spirosoma sp. KCTC 42546]